MAEDLNICPCNLAGCGREYREDSENAFSGMGKLKPEDEELAKLRKKNADLKEGSRTGANFPFRQRLRVCKRRVQANTHTDGLQSHYGWLGELL